MSIILRWELFVLAIVFLLIVISNVNKKNLKLKYSLIWILAAVILVVIAIAPGLVYEITKFMGIETPSNFIFLVSLIWLIGMNLSLTVIASRQAEKIKKITQLVSLENYEKDTQAQETEQYNGGGKMK